MEKYKIMTRNAFNALETKEEIMYLLTNETGLIEDIIKINNNRIVIFREGKEKKPNNVFKPEVLGVINKKIGDEIDFPDKQVLCENYVDYDVYYFLKDWIDSNDNVSLNVVPNENITLYASRYLINVPHKMKIQNLQPQQVMVQPFVIKSSIPLYFKQNNFGDNFLLRIENINRTQVTSDEYSQSLICVLETDILESEIIQLDIDLEVYKDSNCEELIGLVHFEIEFYVTNSSSGD